ncbi:putative transposase [Nocardia farcinica IFM 10152]|uniref:Putative transposase n=1 Tax=Nocardia farcinica (strain IFM 10152) TaxID=247156 RepID=Q5YY37_NOCFA|nr:putative transposase [Nocardia farcinica IFM 10152]
MPGALELVVSHDVRSWSTSCPSGWCLTSCGSWWSRCYRSSAFVRRVEAPRRSTSGRCSRQWCMCWPACAWRMLPPSFGVTVPTAPRRFTVWTETGVWRRLHRAVLR